MDTTNLPGPIVKEALNEGNYKEWSVCIRNYLLAQDLWDVVQTDYPRDEEKAAAGEEEKHRVWRRKDAAAFHAIMMSCGKKVVDLILDLSSAKAAWDMLAKEYGNSAVDEIDDETDWYDAQYQSLYEAIRNGDWAKTKQIIDVLPEALTAVISYGGKRALHVAAAFKRLHIVEGLVELMSREDLEFRDAYGDTALIHACFAGITKVAECMVNKNEEIIIIPRPTQYLLPVTVAIVSGYEETARYLYLVTPLEKLLPDKGYYGVSLLIECLHGDNLLDMALDLLRRCPQLAITPNDGGDTFVEQLATRPSIFQSGRRLKFFQKWIYDWINIEPRAVVNEFRIDVQSSNTRASDGKISPIRGRMDRAVSTFFDLLGINQIYETKWRHKQSQELLRIACDEIRALNSKKLKESGLFNSLFRAAEYGMPEFIIEVIKANPALLALSDEGKVYVDFFFSAVEHRQAQVFNLIHGFIWKSEVTCIYNGDGFTMLHKAGKLAPQEELNSTPGAALQMQRELQWFKEVESIMAPTMKEIRNKDGMTARNLFTREHKDLVKEGEKWMKETATSCTVVGALIITIMFAAAFTIPGGSNQDTGYPILQGQKSFMFFIISDAISLFSSTTSVLMFLGILTSRYREEDFLKSLPTKLIIGLSMLFISIATMMTTFCAALFIMLEGKLWIATPVILLASVPVGLFVKLQFPLLIEIIVSTFGPGIFNRNVNRWP